MYYSPFEDKENMKDGNSTLYLPIEKRDEKTGDLTGYDIRPVDRKDLLRIED